MRFLAVAALAALIATASAFPSNANGLCSYGAAPGAMGGPHGPGNGQKAGLAVAADAAAGTYTISMNGIGTYKGLDLWVADAVDGTHVGSVTLPAGFSYNTCGPNAQSTIQQNSATAKTTAAFTWTPGASAPAGKTYVAQAVVVVALNNWFTLTPAMFQVAAAAAPPTMAPPTIAPPTMAPPTMAPPTMSPSAAPTMAPPTMAAPTMSASAAVVMPTASSMSSAAAMPTAAANTTRPISTNWQCGPANGNTACPAPNCCSKWGWCGVLPAYCGTGCMPGFGLCTGMAPTSAAAAAATSAVAAATSSSAAAQAAVTSSIKVKKVEVEAERDDGRGMRDFALGGATASSTESALPLPVVVGGIVGGVAALALVAGMTVLRMRRGHVQAATPAERLEAAGSAVPPQSSARAPRAYRSGPRPGQAIPAELEKETAQDTTLSSGARGVRHA